jgi:hypothetical protein
MHSTRKRSQFRSLESPDTLTHHSSQLDQIRNRNPSPIRIHIAGRLRSESSPTATSDHVTRLNIKFCQRNGVSPESELYWIQAGDVPLIHSNSPVLTNETILSILLTNSLFQSRLYFTLTHLPLRSHLRHVFSDH